jgi:hypothetical protein
MICDTRPIRKEQTLAERQDEVRKAILGLTRGLASGKIRVVIGAQGAIAFAGWLQDDKAGISDACAFRLATTGPHASPLAKQAIQRAEILAGRTVNQKAVAAGVHSHDGGKTWHPGH